MNKPKPPLLDTQAIIDGIAEIGKLRRNWDGYQAETISSFARSTAMWVATRFRTDIVETPKVVPMTRGRLQFEWRRGERSLEIEFDDSDFARYLKWDGEISFSEEGQVPWRDWVAIQELLFWFAGKGARGLPLHERRFL